MRPLKVWWYIPLVAIVGIVIKAFLVASMLTGSVEEASIGALDEAGLGDVVDYAGYDGVSGLGRNGLNVLLEGPASAEQAAVEAVMARDEVDSVSYRATATGENEPGAPAAAPEPMSIGIEASAEQVVVTGVVPDAQAKDSIVSAAVTEYGGERNVVDELEVGGDDLTAVGGRLVVTGFAASADEKAAWLAPAAAVADAGGLALVDEVEVEPGESSPEEDPLEDPADELPESSIVVALNALFALDPIEFDVGQSTIRPASIPTLDEAAKILVMNPDAGTLLVVGHTDGDGSEEANLALSASRSVEIVNYLVGTGGVDASRLVSEGRGEAELLVSPEQSPQDKQRNRRIEWERSP